MKTKTIKVTVIEAVWQKSQYLIEVPTDMPLNEYRDAFHDAICEDKVKTLYSDEYIDNIDNIDKEYDFEVTK